MRIFWQDTSRYLFLFFNQQSNESEGIQMKPDETEHGSMTIAVIGSGGREFCIAERLAQEGHTVFCIPGNAGMAKFGFLVSLKVTETLEILKFVEAHDINLTVVGPEGPLVNDGIVDLFRANGRLICGPNQLAAMMEGSKARFKQFLVRHGLPTPPFKVFNVFDEAFKYVCERGVENIVIKADDLREGKGVVLPSDRIEAVEELEKFLKMKSTDDFKCVLVEDRHEGEENSVIAMVDKRTVRMMSQTRDYKRVGNGNTGRNGGGSGAHTLDFPAEDVALFESFLQRVADGMADEGRPFTGFMYLGLVKTKQGYEIYELNCRLGDPEAGAILSSMEGDLAGSCMAIAEGRLAEVPPLVQVCHSFTVVFMDECYPDSSPHDDVVEGIPEAEKVPGAKVIHAGTALRNGVYSTAKAGRVLQVNGKGRTVAEARAVAYLAAGKIKSPHLRFRTDMGIGV